MKNYKLSFISDEDLYGHVLKTVNEYRNHLTICDLESNILDPIKLTFDSKVYKKDVFQLLKDELLRQIDKSNNNSIGYFNQNIFKYFGNGWTVPEKGFDVVNNELKIFAEVKTKLNTMNSSSSQKTYIQLLSKINEDPDNKCYLVQVISKKSQNVPWSITVNNSKVSNEKIRLISIDKFYSLVTGDSNSFAKLCEILPQVIDDVVSNTLEVSNDDLARILRPYTDMENPLLSIYIKAFKTFEGFNNFEFSKD